MQRSTKEELMLDDAIARIVATGPVETEAEKVVHECIAVRIDRETERSICSGISCPGASFPPRSDWRVASEG